MRLERSTLKNIVKEEQERLDNELARVEGSEKIPDVEIPEELQSVQEFMSLTSEQQIKLTFVLALGVKKFEEYHVSSLTTKELTRLLEANGYSISEYQWVIDNKQAFVQWYVNVILMIHAYRFAKMSKKGMTEG